MSEKDVPPQGAQSRAPKTSLGLSSNVENHPTIAAMAAARSWEENPAIKAMAAATRSWEENPAIKAMAAATRSWEENPAIKAMAAATRSWEENPAIKAMAAATRSWEENPAIKAMAAATRSWEENPAIKAMAAATRSWEENPAIKAMAAAASNWESNPAFKAAIAAAQSLEAHSRMRELAESTLALEKWGVSGALTVGVVLDELATRTVKTVAQPTEEPHQLPQEGKYQSAVELSDSYSIEVVTAAPQQSLKGMPTWALLCWLYMVVPLLFVAINWESAREGLADINARLPQTDSLAGIRNFIRIELAGKPGDIRLVKGSDVRLRDGPGMKSEVILLLPPDAIVVVLSKEDRTWRYVSYEHRGYMIDGYVSTKHLKKVRK